MTLCSPRDLVIGILRVWVFDRFIDAVFFRQHAVVKDARHNDSSRLAQIEDDVPSAVHTTQSVKNVITHAAEIWVVGQILQTRFKIIKITRRLRWTPGLQGVSSYLGKVELCSPR